MVNVDPIRAYASVCADGRQKGYVQQGMYLRGTKSTTKISNLLLDESGLHVSTGFRIHRAYHRSRPKYGPKTCVSFPTFILAAFDGSLIAGELRDTTRT